MVERLFVLKYADPQQVSDLLHVFEASITPNTAFHALAIRTAPSTMTALEQTIARLDVPSAAPRDIDLTAQLLLGAGSPEHAGDALPKDLESVVAQLRQSFPFKNYGLLDVLTLRLRTGRTNGQTSTSSVGGTIQVEGRAMPVNSSLNLNGVSLGGDAAEVRIDGFRFSTRIPVSNGPGQVSMNDIRMHTDLDIKDGQKVVVGLAWNQSRSGSVCGADGEGPITAKIPKNYPTCGLQKASWMARAVFSSFSTFPSRMYRTRCA